jgi:hypothetical protein
MSLSPAPLLPGLSPLPIPGRQPPSPRAVRLGAVVAIVTLVVGLVAGQFALPYMLFLAPGLGAKAYAGGGVQNDTSFQGFVFNWDRYTAEHGGIQGGYNTPDSLKNMSSQAKDFHMNAVIIPVYMDMADRSDRKLSCNRQDADNLSTLPDGDYDSAIRDAIKAGLVPILELRVRVHTGGGGAGLISADEAGVKWSADSAGASVTPIDGSKTDSAGNMERSWFDKYTACAVRFAQMSKGHNLPFFIIGDGLSSLSYDTDSTNAKVDPNGLKAVRKPGDPSCDNAAGRRECEWRHVIHAIKSQNYPALSSNDALTGAAYTGKLIYAASWTHANNEDLDPGGATQMEFDHITWWDAVDFIGVDANFPLTKDQPDAPVNVLMNAWKGQGPNHASDNIYQSLGNVSDAFQRAVIFTDVQYASAASANTGNPTADSGSDEVEQDNDMQALVKTFSDASWWAGVFWDGDQPIAPRSKQANWSVGSNWAGDTPATSKQAGKWLASYYHDSPLECPGCK